MAIKIQYQTARGMETPSLREVNDHTNSSFGTNYDYVLRGAVPGWPTRDFQVDKQLLEELLKDVWNIYKAHKDNIDAQQ